MKFNGLLLLPVALILIIAITSKQKKSRYDWHSTSRAYLHDSLPPSFLMNVNPVEIQGYKIQEESGSTTYYYEYTADHQQVLKEIAALPFPSDSIRADLQCRAITELSEITQLEELLKDERITQTFRTEPVSNYTIYQCLKSQQHFILLDNTSDKVIHIIHHG